MKKIIEHSNNLSQLHFSPLKSAKRRKYNPAFSILNLRGRLLPYYFLVKEIIDHYWRLAVFGADGVVVANVGQTRSGSKCAQLHIELHTIRTVFLCVDIAIKRIESRMMLVYPLLFTTQNLIDNHN